MEMGLIELVKKCPFLYDNKNFYYKNRELKKKQWREISDVLNVKVFKAKTRWKSLRDNYRREKKNVRNVKWKYFDMLTFLDNPPTQNISNMTSETYELPSQLFEETAFEINDLKVEETVTENPNILTNVEEVQNQTVNDLTPTMSFFQSLAIQVDSEKLSFLRFSTLQSRVLSIVHEEIWKNREERN